MTEETDRHWRTITSLAPDARVLMSYEGKFYVSCRVERKERGCLVSDCHFHEPTVERAISRTFQHITNPRFVFVRDAMRPSRTEWRWHSIHDRFMPESTEARDYTPKSNP